MALKLMYITNDSLTAQIAEAAGVDRIFVDMEVIGKAERQKGTDSVLSHHTQEDVKQIRSAIRQAELLVRINPLHGEMAGYDSSEKEIEQVIANGADRIMLPWFHDSDTVREFLQITAGRVKTTALVETKEAAESIGELLELEGLDEIYIGLNDLSICYGKQFLFELLADGTVENLCMQCRKKGIDYGFGGIGGLGKGLLPAEFIIRELYRLRSSSTILSRSFWNQKNGGDLQEIFDVFMNGVREIRKLERECEEHSRYFQDNERQVAARVQIIREKGAYLTENRRKK